GIRTEIGKLIEHLGYGNQPYLVYKHADLDRVHFHIVSTRIDCDTGKKIKDSYEKEKTQQFIKGLEQKYQLTKDDTQEKVNYRFSGASKNLKQNLESLFGQLNRMEFISSKELYDQALGLFQVEIKKAGRGHLVFVTDENGNPVRHPVKMSDFEESPKFYLSEKRDMNEKINPTMKSVHEEQDVIIKGILKSMVLKELLWQMQARTDEYRGKRNKIKKQYTKRIRNKHM
ncbi:MAG: relaxase/mobilization nuclease domain-containing protein, partial [Candidatus Delongbacteria bacterium]|nr:relaxase/mobilization nuclease domain-containing protein [Candidatus Delongbacteria bacterium]